jgi:hypothetical protein
MKRGRRPILLLAAVLTVGAARIPLEQSLTGTLKEQNLLPVPLGLTTREKIGQTSSAVALGGLRTLVATFLNLRAFDQFTEQRWDEVDESFQTIVDLAPRTNYYWETGSWHQAYNAASYYLYDSDLPPLRKREAWRSSILRGRKFLERGIRNNPDQWTLYANLGFLLSDSNKFQAFENIGESFSAAADAYEMSAKTGKALPYVVRARLYSLARSPGREKEALDLARQLYQSRNNRTPTLLAVLFVLEINANPQLDGMKLALALYGDETNAYDGLSSHWLRKKERFPAGEGLAAVLMELEKRLGILPDKSVFQVKDTTPLQQDDWLNDPTGEARPTRPLGPRLDR